MALRDRIVSGTFLFVLIFSPLAFGSVEKWSLAALEAGCAIALAAYAWNAKGKEGRWREVPGILPLLLLLGVMAFQLVPLPQSVLSVLSPKSLQVYTETLGVFGDDFWAPTSLDRHSSFMELMRYLSYACFYVLGVQLMSDKGQLRMTARVVVIFAATLAFVSLLHKFSSSQLILWVREAPAGSTFTGPYVNKNHFAAYMGMVFPLAAGLFLIYRPTSSGAGLMGFLESAAGHKRIHKHFIFGFASLVIASSVIVSLSRGGIVSLCISMVVMSILVAWNKKGRGLALGVLFLATAVLVGWFGWDPIIERFGSVVDNEGVLELNRTFIWADAIRVFRDFPLLGTGFGSFGSIYPSYRSFPGHLVVDHAHNDYLELLAEGGVLSFALAAWFVFAVVIKALRAVRVRREPYSITMGIAGISAMLYMLIHAFVDFNMHIGANALYFFFTAAFAITASHTRLHENRRGSLLKKLSYGKGALSFYLIAAFCVLILATNIMALAGVFDVREQDSIAASPGTEGSLDGYREAIAREPTNVRLLQAAAVAIDIAGDTPGAKALMQASLKHGAGQYKYYLRYSSWLLGKGDFSAAREIAMEGMAKEPGSTVYFARVFAAKGLSAPEILGVLPAMAGPHVRLAEYFLKSGDTLIADDTYWRALDLMVDGGALNLKEYSLMYRYFMAQSRYDAALAVASALVDHSPARPESWKRLALVYEKKGDIDRAIKYFEQALLLAPDDKVSKRRLKRLAGKRR